VIVPSAANAAGSTNYACFNGGGAPIQYTSKTPPSKCDGGIYRISKDGKVVVQIDLRRTKTWADFVARLKRAHTSANAYCSNNPTDCIIYSTIGAALLAPILAANS
jgi:hypothetical protein